MNMVRLLCPQILASKNASSVERRAIEPLTPAQLTMWLCMICCMLLLAVPGIQLVVLRQLVKSRMVSVYKVVHVLTECHIARRTYAVFRQLVNMGLGVRLLPSDASITKAVQNVIDFGKSILGVHINSAIQCCLMNVDSFMKALVRYVEDEVTIPSHPM